MFESQESVVILANLGLYKVDRDVFKHRIKSKNFIEPLSNELTVTNHDILLPLSFQQ